MDSKNISKVDALMEKWSDDGASRGAAFIELRDLARELESAAAPQVVADERAAQRARVHAKVLAMPDSDVGNLIGPPMKCELPPDGWYCTRMPGHEGPCAALAAAPVQAQEPVPEAAQQNGGLVCAALIDLLALERHALAGCLNFEAQNDCRVRFARARKALSAPVQPVAVPDGWTCTKEHDLGTVTDAQGNHIARSYYKEMKAVTDRHNSSIAAPAAQGDAKDAERYRWLRDKSEPGICAFYLSVGKAFDGVKFNQATVDEAIDAQIAAIAAKAAS